MNGHACPIQMVLLGIWLDESFLGHPAAGSGNAKIIVLPNDVPVRQTCRLIQSNQMSDRMHPYAGDYSITLQGHYKGTTRALQGVLQGRDDAICNQTWIIAKTSQRAALSLSEADLGHKYCYSTSSIPFLKQMAVLWMPTPMADSLLLSVVHSWSPMSQQWIDSSMKSLSSGQT